MVIAVFNTYRGRVPGFDGNCRNDGKSQKNDDFDGKSLKNDDFDGKSLKNDDFDGKSENIDDLNKEYI